MINKKCPICFGELKYRKSFMIVMDGNSVYDCQNDKRHQFWHNARDCENTLYWHPNSSNTNFNWYICYYFNQNNDVEKILINENFIEYVNDK